jgi:hypothetical protein
MDLGADDEINVTALIREYKESAKKASQERRRQWNSAQLDRRVEPCFPSQTAKKPLQPLEAMAFRREPSLDICNEMEPGVVEPTPTLIEVTGFSIQEGKKGKFVAYTVCVGSSKSVLTLRTQKRYTEFKALHRRLKKEIKGQILPLPRASLIRSFNESYIRNKQYELQQYLQALVELHPSSVQQPALKEFLTSECNLGSIERGKLGRTKSVENDVASSVPPRRLQASRSNSASVSCSESLHHQIHGYEYGESPTESIQELIIQTSSYDRGSGYGIGAGIDIELEESGEENTNKQPSLGEEEWPGAKRSQRSQRSSSAVIMHQEEV